MIPLNILLSAYTDCSTNSIILKTLRDAICKYFLPPLLQGNISNDEEELFFLPVCLAGLGMRDPTKTAEVRGVWSPQTEALFDIRIIDTDAPSYKHCTPEAILESAAKEKKRIYPKAVEDRRGQFTPFVVSVDGLLHREANHFMKHIAASLATKWEKSYSETVSFVRTKLSFAILRSTCN